MLRDLFPIAKVHIFIHTTAVLHIHLQTHTIAPKVDTGHRFMAVAFNDLPIHPITADLGMSSIPQASCSGNTSVC